MKRKDFIRIMSIASMAGGIMNLNQLDNLTSKFGSSEQMPALFLGHGSPMNAIEENEFVLGFRNIARQIPTPKAILVVSAHWETKGTMVTAMDSPRTIHDFGGFPKALHEQQYPAPGSKDLADETRAIIQSTEVRYDYDWGLDHGAWVVLKHMYPNANIPVAQLSIDYTKDSRYHYELSNQLSNLRNRGILIIGSGNMVHNLRVMDWSNVNTIGHGFDWALEAREKMKAYILNGNHDSLINYRSQGQAFDLSIPTPEHFLPLLYVLALKNSKDEVQLFNDKAIAGSITMTSVKIG